MRKAVSITPVDQIRVSFKAAEIVQRLPFEPRGADNFDAISSNPT
jgi:hypothetical protein